MARDHNLFDTVCDALLFRYRCGMLVRWAGHPFGVFEITQRRYTTWPLGGILVEYALVPVQGTMPGTGGWAREEELARWKKRHT